MWLGYYLELESTEFFLVRIFLYSVWIHENTDRKKTPYLDTFHAVNTLLEIKVAGKSKIHFYLPVKHETVISQLKFLED